MRGIEIAEPFEKECIAVRESGDGVLEIVNVARGESKVHEMLETFVETAKYGIFATEWVPSEEEFKHRWIFVAIALPVRIRHGDLIEICQQRGDERVRRRRKRRGGAAIVSCIRHDSEGYDERLVAIE